MSETSGLVIDLHEDVADYYMTEDPKNDFSKDIVGRQADFPKYRKAGAMVVVASIFSLIRSGIQAFQPIFRVDTGDSDLHTQQEGRWELPWSK